MDFIAHVAVCTKIAALEACLAHKAWAYDVNAGALRHRAHAAAALLAEGAAGGLGEYDAARLENVGRAALARDQRSLAVHATVMARAARAAQAAYAVAAQALEVGAEVLVWSGKVQRLCNEARDLFQVRELTARFYPGSEHGPANLLQAKFLELAGVVAHYKVATAAAELMLARAEAAARRSRGAPPGMRRPPAQKGQRRGGQRAAGRRRRARTNAH